MAINQERPNVQFTGHLYPFQQNVLDWSQKIHRGIMGLDMGLGKTIITIAMIFQRNYQHTLIVVPLGITEQWRAAFANFSNLPANQICLYHGRRRNLLDLSHYRVVLTTYDMIRTDMVSESSVLYQSKDLFNAIFLDEAHKIRNDKTVSYVMCSRLSLNIEDRWLLTGTTIHNKFSDFYNLCKFLDLHELSPTVFYDTETTTQWRNKYYYRLLKSQIALDLPEKSLHEHYLAFGQKHVSEYLELFSEVKKFYEDYVSDPTRVNFSFLMVKILRLRQCCNHPDAALSEKLYQLSKNRHDTLSSAKFNKIKQIIRDAPTDDKILIFSQWTHSLEVLKAHLRLNGVSYLKYHGAQDVSEKNQVIDEFKKGKARVLLMSLTSGGVGLDLSCANHVIIMDSWWNQALEEQAIDRVYRIGQKKKVEVHRLYMKGTIEEWMVEMKREKMMVDTQFHNRNTVYQTDEGLLKEILHRYI